jgi:hypothetical protein
MGVNVVVIGRKEWWRLSEWVIASVIQRPSWLISEPRDSKAK